LIDLNSLFRNRLNNGAAVHSFDHKFPGSYPAILHGITN